jgi:hypothetical protein
MMSKLQKGYKSTRPKIKSIEEKILKLLPRPLSVLEILIIHFSPKAPQ